MSFLGLGGLILYFVNVLLKIFS